MLFYLFLLIHSISSITVYSGGCDILNDKLYFIGGSTYKPDNKSIHIPSNKVYSLDLKDGFTLEDNVYAPWKTINEKAPAADYANVVANEKSNSLFIFGGKTVPKDKSFKQYSVEDNSFKINNDALNSFSFPKNLSQGEKQNYGYYFDSFTRDNKNKNLYYHFGGVTAYADFKTVSGRGIVSSFNSLENKFKFLKNEPVYIYSHLSAALENKLYLIGGASVFDNKSRMMDVIMIYDYTTNSFKNYTATGDIPQERIGASSFLLKDKLIILGGSIDSTYKSFPKASIYTLDLNDLVYKEYKVDNFINSYGGCLTYYNNHLIYSFGYHANEIISTTQIINVENWSLVQSLPKLNTNDNNVGKSTLRNSTEINTDTSSVQPNLPAIIGGSIGGLIALILIILLIIYLVRKNKKTNQAERAKQSNSQLTNSVLQAYPDDYEELAPPEILKGNVWTPNKPGEINEAEFTLNTDTVMPDLDDDVHDSSHHWGYNSKTN